jgi:hypothetical protein
MESSLCRDGTRTQVSCTRDFGIVCVRIVGAVGDTNERQLALIEALLARAAPYKIVFDLGPTTFTGAVLMNFLLRVATASPGAVVLCRPTLSACQAILVSDLILSVAVREDLPPEWVESLG